MAYITHPSATYNVTPTELFNVKVGERTRVACVTQYNGNTYRITRRFPDKSDPHNKHPPLYTVTVTTRSVIRRIVVNSNLKLPHMQTVCIVKCRQRKHLSNECSKRYLLEHVPSVAR